MIRCDECRKRRPRWWARRRGWLLGGVVGWYDFCSLECRIGYYREAYER